MRRDPKLFDENGVAPHSSRYNLPNRVAANRQPRNAVKRLISHILIHVTPLLHTRDVLSYSNLGRGSKFGPLFVRQSATK